MSWQCLNPLVAYSLCKDSDGKNVLKFQNKHNHFNLKMLKDKYGSDHVFLLPCGQCESCRRNYAENWAIRCVLEAKEHQFNYFLTLTFDDAHILKASKKDFDLFLDRLEGKNHVNKFKYFACIEYGETTNRLHFHMILFSDFDLGLYDATKVGDFYYYHSHVIDKVWNCGLYNVAPFESSCARYVAKYTNKNGSKIFMSRNLGKSYVIKNAEKIINDDFKVYGDFGDKFCVNLPVNLLRWLPEDYSLLGITKLKSLGALVHNYKVRLYGAPYEESVINNAREKALNVNVKRRYL